MEYMLLPLKRYADFSGRSRRKEYWMFFLFYMLIAIVIGALIGVSAITGGFGPGGGLVTALLTIAVVFALIIPSIAVQVRRFHDQDKSGWLVLLNFVPYVGGIIVLVFMCLEGTRGPNRFGPDPKEVENIGDVFS